MPFRPTRAQTASKATESEPAVADSIGHFFGGPGFHVSQSLLAYPRSTDPRYELVRSYPNPGTSLSLDLEFQTKRLLLGVSLLAGSMARSEPPALCSLHAWAASILGSGEIAPYIGGGFGALMIGEDERLKIGPAAIATVGVLFFRSRPYLRPEFTLQVVLPIFDTSNSMFFARPPGFWPVAVLGVRLLI